MHTFQTTNKMSQQITALKKAIETSRNNITGHSVYASIRKPDDLHRFMELHVYAVWDFMSLLKSLQINLTCTTLPWLPKDDADAGFLINEIVTGEETDLDLHGRRKSHFEMYIDAMEEAGADTSSIKRFTKALNNGASMDEAFDLAATPEAARKFVRFTFEIIQSGKPHLQAAVFTFGREDLIPDMFLSMIRDLESNHALNISAFRYYLERHIEIDGGHHSQLALDMTARLCGNDPERWKQAEQASINALEMRVRLWDGVLEKIRETAQNVLSGHEA